MSQSSRNKKEGIFCTIYFVTREFFQICFISMYSALNTLKKIFILLHIKKHYFKNFCCLFLISSKASNVSLNMDQLFASLRIIFIILPDVFCFIISVAWCFSFSPGQALSKWFSSFIMVCFCWVFSSFFFFFLTLYQFYFNTFTDQGIFLCSLSSQFDTEFPRLFCTNGGSSKKLMF